MKRALSVIAAASLIAVMWLHAAAGSSGGSSQFSVRFPDSAPIHVVDNDPQGPSAGDVYLFRGNLRGGSGNRVGRVIANATIFDPSVSAAYVEGALHLSGRGNLIAEGRLVFDRQKQGRLTVTGGTGEFAGMSGTVTSTIRHGVVTLTIDLH